MKLVKLCAVLAAVLAFGLVGTATASAIEFHTNSTGVTLEGRLEAPQEFRLGTYSPIVCNGYRLTGYLPRQENSPTQEMRPEITECVEKFNSRVYTANSAGCIYTFYASGSVALNSCTNGGIKFTTETALGPCWVEIPNQPAVAGVSYTNVFDPVLERKYYTSSVNATFKGQGGGTRGGFCPAASTVTTNQQWSVKAAQVVSIWVS